MTHAPRLRAIVAIVALILPFVAILMSWMLWSQQLPPELASHWSGTGAADGFLPTTGVLIGALIATAVTAVGGILACFVGNLSANARRNTVFLLGLIGGVGMAAWLIPVPLTIQAGSSTDIVLGWWLVLLILLPLYGLIPAALLPRAVRAAGTSSVGATTSTAAPDRAGETPERAALIPGENDTFTATSFGAIFVWLMAGLFVFGVLLCGIGLIDGSAAENPIGFVALAFGGFLCAAFSVIRVTVDARGLRITSGLFGIPLKRIRLEHMADVEGTDLRPSDWGGWGYRMTSGRSAIILRGGPGIVVTLTNGKLFALTLPNPDVPAELLNALRDKQLSV